MSNGGNWGQQPWTAPPLSAPPAKKNWFLRHKVLSAILALVVIGIIGGAAGGSSKKSGSPKTTADTSTTSPLPVQHSAPAASAAPRPKAAAHASKAFPGQKDRDRVRRPGESLNLSGWTMTAGPAHRTNPGYGAQICIPIRLVNRDTKTQSYSVYSWKLQSPGGDVKDVTLSAQNNSYGEGDLTPGGVKTGAVCFDDPGQHGLYVALWQPDTFSSDARGAWLNRL